MKKQPRNLKQMLTEGNFIDPEELAIALRVSRPTVYSWVRKGTIPFVKFGELVRFDPLEIQGWLDERKRARAARVPQ